MQMQEQASTKRKGEGKTKKGKAGSTRLKIVVKAGQLLVLNTRAWFHRTGTQKHSYDKPQRILTELSTSHADQS